MGFSTSVIAIKGDFREKSREIFSCFNYSASVNDRAFNHWDQAGEYLFGKYVDFANQEVALRAIWFDSGWTMICDPELVDTTEEGKLVRLSQMLDTEVWTFLIQTSSDSYSFAKYNRAKTRSFFVSGERVFENAGEPLDLEKGFNINGKFCVGEISAITNILGININPELPGEFVVKEMPYDEELKAHLKQL